METAYAGLLKVHVGSSKKDQVKPPKNTTKMKA